MASKDRLCNGCGRFIPGRVMRTSDGPLHVFCFVWTSFVVRVFLAPFRWLQAAQRQQPGDVV